MSQRTAKPQILLLEEVEKCEKDVLQALAALPDGSAVEIVMNSIGGSVYAGLAIGTLIRRKGLRCHAVVLADCSSAALLVFAACESREVAEHASFLFHPMQWSTEEHTRLNGARSWSKEFARLCTTYEEWLEELLPLPRPVLKKWITQERYVTASELVERGIAKYLKLHGRTSRDVKVVPVTPAATRSRRSKTPAKIRRVG